MNHTESAIDSNKQKGNDVFTVLYWKRPIDEMLLLVRIRI